MCAILGAILRDTNETKMRWANKVLEHMSKMSFDRGRDGRGYIVLNNQIFGARQIERAETWDQEVFFEDPGQPYQSMIANFRAEPTTEYVAEKNLFDQQPYRAGPWMIVHNGTIANDKELRTGELLTSIDSAAIAEVLNSFPSDGMTREAVSEYFATCIEKLKGSYAILAMHEKHPGCIWTASNYRPIWIANDQSTNAVYFASSADYFPPYMVPRMLQPYAMYIFTTHGQICLRNQTTPQATTDPTVRPYARTLVVCSGGLDSVVAATAMLEQGYAVELVHFRYGSRAEGPEVKAVRAVAEDLGVKVHIHDIPIYKPEDSPLLRADSDIAGGEAGAEFAHEWVPARNLVMLSIATAFAEAGGFDFIVLGNNLEEAGAYPDNEPEFIHRFNEVLPFAVGDGKRVRVMMPVGNLMKHEIVALGAKLEAPMDLTWSCYRAGEKHCGTCGPCHMRRTAFAINGLEEVIDYEKD